jgi:UDP-N-acetylglucosamine 2-epimerase
MLSVMTIVGTRPEVIRLSRIIPLFDRYCRHTLVHTGQNYDYELNQVFFDELAIRQPDHFLQAAGDTAAETIGRVLMAADRILAEVRPDALLILGDTNSTLAAIVAKRRRIPIFHMEAGNRCFDFRVPEEINRRIVDHVSDINITYSQIARTHLLSEGLPADQIICTGSPMREVITHYQQQIADSTVLRRIGVVKDHYFVVSSHREENVDNDENLTRLFGILNELANRFGEPIIFSTHPRTRIRIQHLGLEADPLVQFHRPFGFFDYLHLQQNAKAALSDSGTITEEASILNFRALNLREVHERPEGFEEGAVMLVGLDACRVMEGLSILSEQPTGDERLLQLVADYNPTNVSHKILRIVQSYTAYVKRKVWRTIS